VPVNQDLLARAQLWLEATAGAGANPTLSEARALVEALLREIVPETDDE
jgi:hypothetical protein